MFLQVCVCPRGGGRLAWQGACVAGACMAGGHAWWEACGGCVAGGCVAGGHARWGTCVVGGMHGGGVHGRACMAGGHAWWGHVWQGDVHGRGACVVWQIPRDTVNERTVRILLECILVWHAFCRKLYENERIRRGASLAPFPLCILQWQ